MQTKSPYDLPRAMRALSLHRGHFAADYADLRGGAGGGASQTTKRKRPERELLQGLQHLLESFGDAPADTQPDHDQSLLSAFKALVQRAESNPTNLLSELSSKWLAMPPRCKRKNPPTVLGPPRGSNRPVGLTLQPNRNKLESLTHLPN